MDTKPVTSLRTIRTAFELFERGILTYEELLADPEFANDPHNTPEWRQAIDDQLDAAAARYDTIYPAPDDVPDKVWYSDATITPLEDGTLAVTEREDTMNANPFDSLPDDPKDVATDEGQAALAAAAKAADEARRLAKKEAEKSAAKAAAAKKAADAELRKPSPVEIVQVPTNGQPTKAARKAGVKPTVGDALVALAGAMMPEMATRAALDAADEDRHKALLQGVADKVNAKAEARKSSPKPKAVAMTSPQAETPKGNKPLKLGTEPIEIDGVKYLPILHRDGEIALHQTDHYIWKCACGRRLRSAQCVGTPEAAHDPITAPAGYRREDRIVR